MLVSDVYLRRLFDLGFTIVQDLSHKDGVGNENMATFLLATKPDS